MGSIKEGEIGDEVNEKIYVAVSKDLKACKSNLVWAIQKLKGKKICLVHVHQPAQYIPILGGYFHVSSLSEEEVKTHQEKERQEMCNILDVCIDMCAKIKVEVEKLYIEKETVESGLVELISEHKIQKLVMGAAADKSYSRKMKEPKSKKANYVLQHAPPSCHIWFICKGHLIYTREGTEPLHLNVQVEHLLARRDSSASINTTSSEASNDQSSSKFSISELSLSQLVEVSPEYQLEKQNEESSFRSFVMPPVTEDKDEHPSSSQNVQEKERINSDIYIQLDQAILEAENAKQEAFEESTKRRKAEIDALEAIRKGNAAECMYYEEFSRRKELEEELANAKEELEITKKQRDMALEELRLAASDKLLLANKFDNMEKEMEKIISALELLQDFKKV